MKKITLLILLLTCLALPPFLLGKAASSRPFVVRVGGQYPSLAIWEGATFRPIAFIIDDRNWGNPYLSPDGSNVVYAGYGIIPGWMRKLTKGDVPIDIFLHELYYVGGSLSTDDHENVLIDQPDDAYFGPEGARKFVVRSEPTWSPTGDAIAWTEYTVDDEAGKPPTTAQLKAYSFAYRYRGGAERTLAENIPLQSGDHRLGSLKWGSAGFLYSIAQDKGSRILVYSGEGEVRLDKQMDFRAEAVWATTNNGFTIAVAPENTQQYQVLELKTGKLSPLTLATVPNQIDVAQLDLFNPTSTFSGGIEAHPEDEAKWLVGVGGTYRTLDGLASTRAFPTNVMGVSYEGGLAGYVDKSGSLVIIDMRGTDVINKIAVELGGEDAPIVSFAWGLSEWRIYYP